MGLIWLFQFECTPHAKSMSHPDAAARIRRTVDQLDLADDSFASEIMSYAIKVLIDPEGNWPADSEKPLAKDALIDALIRLNRKIHDSH